MPAEDAGHRRRSFFFLGPGGASRRAQFAQMPKLDEQPGATRSAPWAKLPRWLAPQVEALGVENLSRPFAAAEVLHGERGARARHRTGDMASIAEGNPGPNFTPRHGIGGKYTLFAEGARGHLPKQLIRKVRPRCRTRAAEIRHPHQGSLGDFARAASPGLVQHSFSWPLDNRTRRRSPGCIHYGENLVSDRFRHPSELRKPTLSPFDEMPRFKDASDESRRLPRAAKRIWLTVRAPLSRRLANRLPKLPSRRLSRPR